MPNRCRCRVIVGPIAMGVKGGTCGITTRLLSKSYFPALLLTIMAAGGVLLLLGIAVQQVSLLAPRSDRCLASGAGYGDLS